MLRKSTPGENGCILYTGYRIPSGYGVTGDNGSSGRTELVHRASWLIHHPGECISKDMVVRHACRSRQCFASAHLSLGTREENAGDRVRDGTQGYGQAHHSATLSNDVVLAIYASRGQGTTQERGERFGVNPKLIGSIDVGKRWARITKGAEAAEAARRLRRAQRVASAARPVTEDTLRGAWLRLGRRSHQTAEGCLVPAIPPNPQGYCSLNIGGRLFLAHRISWMYHHNNSKPVPDGMHVRHMCGNRACIAPAHLKIGTPVENNADKITEADRVRTRNIFASHGSGTQKERAARFGVTVGTVNSIDSGAACAQYSGYTEADTTRRSDKKAAGKDRARRIFASQGTGTAAERAALFGVTPQMIKFIDSGRAWGEVSGYAEAKLKREAEAPAKEKAMHDSVAAFLRELEEAEAEVEQREREAAAAAHPV